MAANADVLLKTILSSFEKNTKKPEKFLSVQNEPAEQFVNITKELYDFTQQTGTGLESNVLQQLIIQDFDDEQVWQEIELQNDPSVKDMVKKVSHLAATKAFDFDLVPKKLEKVDKDSTEEVDSMDIEDENDDLKDNDSSEDSLESPIGIFSETRDGSSDDEEEELLKKALDKLTGDVSGDIGSEESDEEEDSDVDFDFDVDSNFGEKKPTKSRKDNAKKSEHKTSVSKQAPKRKTVVDDKFFKLADMETFLDQEDAKEEKKLRREKGEEVESSDDDESEDIDVFAADDEDDEEEDEGEEQSMEIKYEDFFDPPDDENIDEKKEKSKKEKPTKIDPPEEDDDEKDDDDDSEDDNESEDDEESEEEENGKNKDLFGEEESDGEDAEEILGQKKQSKESQFEQRQARMKKRISEIEEAMLEEKPWQLTGEASAKSRPENSLLQEDLDFEHTTKVAPVITEETTLKLEDFIKQRIKDQAWDDVERKLKPKEDPYEYKKRVVLDQEKSKLSLGEVYEQEYIKQTVNEEEKTDPAQEEIKKMMSSLFTKLDALTNFHFTPKPAVPDIKIVSNLPSVVMEEVAPTTVSEAALLAPEEIKDKDKGELKGDTEKDKTDKKRALREKKKKQRDKQKAKEKKQKLVEKVNPGLGNKYAKEKAMKDLEKQSKQSKRVTVIKDNQTTKSGLTSSTKFFSQLQEEVTAHIQTKKAQKGKKDKEKSVSSAKLKL